MEMVHFYPQYSNTFFTTVGMWVSLKKKKLLYPGT